MNTNSACALRLLLLAGCAMSLIGCASNSPRPADHLSNRVPAALLEPPEQSNYLERALIDIRAWRETLSGTRINCEDGSNCSGGKSSSK